MSEVAHPHNYHFGIIGGVAVCVIAILSGLAMTGQEELLWCFVGLLSLCGVGAVLWLKMR